MALLKKRAPAPSEDFEAAQAELADTRSKLEAAAAEAKGLSAQIDAAESYEAAQDLTRRAWEARKRASDLGRQIPDLEQKVVAAKRAHVVAKVEPLAREVEAAIRENVANLVAAASSNNRVIEAVNRLRSGVSDQIAAQFLHPSDAVFNGLVRGDLVELYRKHVEAILSKFDRAIDEVSR